MHYLITLPQSWLEYNWRFWSFCTGWCSESEQELEKTIKWSWKLSALAKPEHAKAQAWLGPGPPLEMSWICSIDPRLIHLCQLSVLSRLFSSSFPCTRLSGNKSWPACLTTGHGKIHQWSYRTVKSWSTPSSTQSHLRHSSGAILSHQDNKE